MESRNERDWFTFKEAAARASISRFTLKRYLAMRSNKPPFYRLVPKGRIRFPKDEFTLWVTGKSQKAK